jgi:hypothetical protein
MLIGEKPFSSAAQMRADYLKCDWQDSAPDNTSSSLRARLFDERFVAPKFTPIAH